MPAWRSASPKKRSTRPESTAPVTRAPKPATSPRSETARTPLCYHSCRCVVTAAQLATLPRVSPEPANFRLAREDPLPLGAQLRIKLKDLIASRELAPGEQLPSLRELAAAAGVNVNTVRSVYLRLENEGLVRTEHGRGTFVAGPSSPTLARRELRAQIAALEASLVRLPPFPSEAESARPPRSPGAGLLSEAELEAVRDRLQLRLAELDRQREEVVRRLEVFETAPARRSTASIMGARIRWVGA